MSRLYITDNDAQHKAKVGNYGRRKVIGKGLSKRQAWLQQNSKIALKKKKAIETIEYLVNELAR